MLNSKAVSLSLSLTSAVLYIACAIAFMLFPIGTLKFFNTWFHALDLTTIASAKPTSLLNIIIGLVSIMIVSAVTGAIFTAIYNTFHKKGD
ncbi:MAG: hypothetical protein HY265_00460 [Deltaproteobacteria bacterium]|nr:hypothetical protein [Deltaproteobacteria bacterium]